MTPNTTTPHVRFRWHNKIIALSHVIHIETAKYANDEYKIKFTYINNLTVYLSCKSKEEQEELLEKIHDRLLASQNQAWKDFTPETTTEKEYGEFSKS